MIPYCLALLLGVILLMASGCAQTDQNRYTILIAKNGTTYPAHAYARLGDETLLVPVNVIKAYLYPDIVLEGQLNRAKIMIRQPQFHMETSGLDQRLRNGVELSFRTEFIDNEYYLDISGLEKILGFTVSRQEDFRQVILANPADYPDRQLNKTRPRWTYNGKINLVWENVPFNKPISPDLAKETKISGLDILSPTWFAIAKDGNVVNNASRKYVLDAHRLGYKVWALVRNGDFDPDVMRSILTNEVVQDKAIDQLLVYAALYDLDGINIDFEDIYEADRDLLTAFVARMTKALHEQNLIVSIDVTVPSETPNWSKCYDRRGLGKVVDYMMLMTYDETWAASPVSGPVASLDWVEKGLKNTLALDVPPHKLLLGLPLYNREWREVANGRGGIKAKSKTFYMQQVQDVIQEKNLQPVFLENKGYRYVEYQHDGALHRFWVEEPESIARKVTLVAKYDLAGAASWRRGFEVPAVWPILEQALKGPGRTDPNEPFSQNAP
ncbi:glycoside hydrolase family protein [Acetonema longum DSM 6540]|uniref:Glycoside hydrolase family protein n=2 Tax=Acetonema TaxID=2373 RepID=F7NFY1_9FIRM|nr:glycoside hydrolase family protein [Acetonema longum DSM 6540]